MDKLCDISSSLKTMNETMQSVFCSELMASESMKQSKCNLHVVQTSSSKLRSWRPTSLHILYVFFI